jgi:hypothetical protein
MRGKPSASAMNWKLALLLVLLALPGVVATSWLALPLLVDDANLPVPLQTLQIATALQSAVLVVVASIVGAMLAPRIGLSAPVLSAAAGSGKVLDALRPQLVPAFVGGCAGAAVIGAFHAFAPEPLARPQAGEPLPLVVRVLYGGITEEVLIRWGLMTAVAWAAWRIFRKDGPSPSRAIMWSAIVLSALVFGISHAPAVAGALAGVTAGLVAYVTIANAVFGVVAGYLFWRYGLEAAIGAHILAHVFAYAVRG